MQFALSVALACVVFWLLGSSLLRRVHPRAGAELPFTSIYCAQMLLWLTSYLVLPLNAGIDALLGVSIPIGVLVWLGAIAVFSMRHRTASPAEGVPSRFALLITVGGAAALIRVALAYSSQSHLGALGLDTHQHLYWTLHILDAGHVPLVERGTEILSLYPKAFHVMTALWTATGVFGASGPWLKLMPFLQAFLPCIVFAELLWARAEKERVDRPAQPLLAFAMSAALLAIAFAFTRMTYPYYDLGGTPRFASAATLFFPYLLFVAGSVFESNLLRRLSWFALPTVAMLLLAMNAVLVAQLIVFVIPLLIVSHWLVPERDASSLGLPTPIVGAAVLTPLAIALTDPWIVAQWSAQLADAGDAYLAAFGAMSPERAAELGLIATDELVEEARGVIEYESVGDIAKLFFTSLLRGVAGLFSTGWSFPYLSDLGTEFGRIAIRVATLGCAAFAIYRTSRRERITTDEQGTQRMRVFAALAIGSIIGGIGQIATFEFTTGLAIGRSYAFELLRDYCEIAPGHVGLVAGTLLLLASIAWLAQTMPRLESLSNAIVHPVASGALALVLVILPITLYGVAETVPPDKSFWAPVSGSDLDDLREIETHIGDEERVMAPSNTWGIGVESWIIPQGPTAGVLPFTTKPFVFNSRLGTSVYFNWKDLANFCRGTKEHRADFLTRNNVRWFLLKGERSGEELFYRKVRMCKLRLAAMGVTYPPAVTAGSLSLYPVDPSAVKASVREVPQR